MQGLYFFKDPVPDWVNLDQDPQKICRGSTIATNRINDVVGFDERRVDDGLLLV